MGDERRSCRVRVVVLLLSLTLVPHRITQALTLGPTPKDAPVEWVATQIGGNIFCLGISWGGPLPSDSGTVFSDFFRLDFSGVCSANGGPGGSGVFPAKRGKAHWAGAFFTDAFTNFSLAAGIPHGRFQMNKVIAYPVVRALIYDRDGMIRAVDHYQGGGPAPIYDANGILPGKQPALWLPFDWGQLRPVYEPSLELTEKPYLKDPTRPDEENLDSIFLLRDDMTVLSGDGKLSDANGWWTAWAGRGDLLLTRLRPNAFTLPGYVPPDDALSDSPPIEIDASDMNPWVAEVMTGYPDLYEPLNITYSPPLGNNMTNDPEDDRRAQVWLHPDYEPQRAPYTMIGQAYSFPLVTGALHTAYADICPLTQDVDGNTTCLPHPYFSPNAPQAGVPPAERAAPVYTFSAPAAPDEEVWLELSATWWDTRTKEEQGAQSGDAGGVEIAHPKGILTSLAPDVDSHLVERVEWRLTSPLDRPDLLETLPATIASEPFTRLVPHARLNISEPGMYDVELLIQGGTGDPSDMNGDILLVDKARIYVPDVDLDGDNESDEDIDEEDDLVEEILPVIVAVNDDVRQLNIRQVGVNIGEVRIKKSGNGKISILNQHGDVILGADDETTPNFLDLVCSKDMVLDLYGEQIGDVNLILEYKYRNFTYTDKLAIKVVQCDIVFRLGSEALASLLGGNYTHGGLDYGNDRIHDIGYPGIQDRDIQYFYSLAANENFKKKMRLKKTQFMSRRIWANVFENIEKRNLRIPTGSKPWNIFSRASDYITANCLEYIHAQFQKALREVYDQLSQPEHISQFQAAYLQHNQIVDIAFPQLLRGFRGPVPWWSISGRKGRSKSECTFHGV